MGTPTTVLTLAQWNQILTNINNSSASCGNTPLPAVTAPHRWSTTDILNAQVACANGGPYTTPVGPPYLWQQKIIDELNAGIAKGCCTCNKGVDGKVIPFGPVINATVQTSCGGAPFPTNTTALAPLINGYQAVGPGINGRGWKVISYLLVNGKPVYPYSGVWASGTVGCSGAIVCNSGTINQVWGIAVYGGNTPCNDANYLNSIAAAQAMIAAGGQPVSAWIPPQPPGWYQLQFCMVIGIGGATCQTGGCPQTCGCNCSNYGVYLYTGSNSFVSCACGNYAQCNQIASSWANSGGGWASIFSCGGGGGGGGGGRS
jgi:hypothetical protein